MRRKGAFMRVGEFCSREAIIVGKDENIQEALGSCGSFMSAMWW
jgi:hypothetical protein